MITFKKNDSDWYFYYSPFTPIKLTHPPTQMNQFTVTQIMTDKFTGESLCFSGPSIGFYGTKDLVPIHVEFTDMFVRLRIGKDRYITDANGTLQLTEKSESSLFQMTHTLVSIYGNHLYKEQEKLILERFNMDKYRKGQGVFLREPRTDAEKLRANGFIVFSLGDEYKEKLAKIRDVLHTSKEQRLSNLKKIDAPFYSLIEHPKIQEILAHVYGKDEYQLSTFSTNTLLQNRDEQNFGWHIDYPYHCLQELPSSILGVQVNFAIDEFTSANGATHFIPESHTFGSFPQFFDPDDYNVQQMLIPEGSVIMYLANLWHCQGKNFTDKPRSAVLANFTPKSVPLKDKELE